MGNKQFILFIIFLLGSFFGWLYYDYQKDTSAIRGQNVTRDMITGGAGESGPTVQYLFGFPEPVLSHELNTQQIESLESGTGASDGRYHIYGLTVADFKTEALYEFSGSKKWFKDEFKMWVENLRVDFSYNSIKVYVNSGYEVGSCPYEKTLGHEKQHVEIHRDVYTQYQKILRDTLTRSTVIPTPAHPLVTASWAEGKERIGKIISGVIDPVFDQFRQALADEQAKIDTPESYSELRGSCSDW